MSPALWIDGALALVVVTYYARHFAFRLYDPDLGGRLAVGRLFSQLGRMPITDPFSYTATLPVWVDHEWLTGVAFHGANCIGGDAAVIVLKTVLGLGMLGFVWATARLNGARTLPLMVLLAIAMPVFGYGLMPRAQVFTYLLFAQWLYLLERARHGGSAWLLMLLPITMPLWANLHGGFLAGLGLLALYALGSIADKPRCARLTLLFVLCVSVTLINPYGLDYWRYLLTAVTMQRPGVHEWAPPPWTASYAQFWFLALSTTIAIVYCLRNRKLRLAPLLVMAVTLILAMCSARHMPLFAIATISFLPRIWSKIIATGASQATWPVRARLLDYLLIACLLAAAAFQGYGMFVLDGPARFDVPGRSTSIENMVVYPVEAIDFAEQQHLQGNLAVPFNWGEYAIWRMYPRCRVSLDGRYETAYPPETVTLVESFFSATSDWRRLLDECPTDHVLAPADSRVNQELAKLPEWHRIHSDPTAVLWSRRSARQASRPASSRRQFFSGLWHGFRLGRALIRVPAGLCAFLCAPGRRPQHCGYHDFCPTGATMRLTLRTMLAYLDDILEPSDSEDIGHKIEESEFASGIVNRIHDCLRRLRLGVPYLNGRGMGGDPNTVAEYLDNTMAPDLVPEFEKVCLESDSHLAEVAACHQILTLVLGEPADVDPNSRQRMYGLIHQPEPQPAEPAEVRAREPQPLVTPAQRHRPEVPDYLREQDRRNETKGRSWFKIAAAILLLAMLGCIGFAGVVFRDQFMAAVPAEGEAKNNAVREVQSQPTAHVPTDESATPLEAEPGSEPVGHTRAANDLSEDGAQPPVGDSTAKDVSPSASDTSDATPAGTDAGVEERGNMTEPATATVDGSAAPAVDALAGTPTTDTSVAPTSDTAATPPAIGGGQIGRYVSDGQVLLRFQSPDDWVRVPARDPLSNNEVLVSLPLFRSTLAFGTGVTVQVMDSSKVELDGPDAQGVPGLRIGFGRVVLMNSGNTNARIRLAIADQFGELVLNEASTVAGLEVLPVLVDGVDPAAQPATIQTILYANTGSVIWRAPGQAQDETIAAPAIRSWTGQVADQPTAGQELPVWLNGELKLNDAERRAAEFLLTSIETDRSARLGLIEISDNRRRFEAKALAVRGLGLIDLFEPLIAALGDPLQRSAWPDHVAALRAALARGPETAAQVRDACEKRRPEHGAELYRLLWGYTEEQLNQGADEQLVGYLDDPDPDLDLRVVAIWNLEHITGEARGYRPQDQLALRQPQVRRWKLWLKNRGAAGGAAS